MTVDIIQHPAVESEADAVIHNPANKAHFMVVRPVSERLRVLVGHTIVAESDAALKVMEVGKSAYPERIYFPPESLKTTLLQSEKQTHCPLKGDASYFTLEEEEIAWSYAAFDFARILDGHYAFWGEQVEIVIVE